MTRCFVGILTPEEVNKNIEKVMEEIKKLPLKCKLVEKENLHICLSFLGEVKENDIKNICKSLDSLALNFKPFEISIKGIKLIPNEKFFRVIALDVESKEGEIEKLRNEVVKVIGGDSKPPHITLCRVKNIENKNLVIKKLTEMKDMEIGRMKVEKIQLIKSELRKEGPIYSIIHESNII
jgi:2'-5' RNA ligase